MLAGVLALFKRLGHDLVDKTVFMIFLFVDRRRLVTRSLGGHHSLRRLNRILMQCHHVRRVDMLLLLL